MAGERITVTSNDDASHTAIMQTLTAAFSTNVTEYATTRPPESDPSTEHYLEAIFREHFLTTILPYSTIFLLSIIGNGMVIATLGLNKRMRTVTNAFLFNLSVSDLLLGVVCMPFTLVGSLVRSWTFGALMCRVIPFLQAVSVSVSSWTLVAMSYELYYAICHPLKSRESRQTWTHTRRVIGSVWLLSFTVMSPIALLSELQSIGSENGAAKYKCRDVWPTDTHLVVFTFFLDIFLFAIPLLVMMGAYARIAAALWQNMRSASSGVPEERPVYSKPAEQNNSETDGGGSLSLPVDKNVDDISVATSAATDGAGQSVTIKTTTRVATRTSSAPRTTNKSVSFRCNQESQRRIQQRRIIKMLFVVVLEFFICWTPLHAINTIALFAPRLIYVTLGYRWLMALQLLAFTSACTNPITYCFMNNNFRQSFLDLFRRCRA